jgi:hypothetical protein
MEWSVVDWNGRARDLYVRRLGAELEEEWTVLRMTPDAFGHRARKGLASRSTG